MNPYIRMTKEEKIKKGRRRILSCVAHLEKERGTHVDLQDLQKLYLRVFGRDLNREEYRCLFGYHRAKFIFENFMAEIEITTNEKKTGSLYFHLTLSLKDAIGEECPEELRKCAAVTREKVVADQQLAEALAAQPPLLLDKNRVPVPVAEKQPANDVIEYTDSDISDSEDEKEEEDEASNKDETLAQDDSLLKRWAAKMAATAVDKANKKQQAESSEQGGLSSVVPISYAESLLRRAIKLKAVRQAEMQIETEWMKDDNADEKKDGNEIGLEKKHPYYWEEEDKDEENDKDYGWDGDEKIEEEEEDEEEEEEDEEEEEEDEEEEDEEEEDEEEEEEDEEEEEEDEEEEMDEDCLYEKEALAKIDGLLKSEAEKIAADEEVKLVDKTEKQPAAAATSALQQQGPSSAFVDTHCNVEYYIRSIQKQEARRLRAAQNVINKKKGADEKEEEDNEIGLEEKQPIGLKKNKQPIGLKNKKQPAVVVTNMARRLAALPDNDTDRNRAVDKAIGNKPKPPAVAGKWAVPAECVSTVNICMNSSDVEKEEEGKEADNNGESTEILVENAQQQSAMPEEFEEKILAAITLTMKMGGVYKAHKLHKKLATKCFASQYSAFFPSVHTLVQFVRQNCNMVKVEALDGENEFFMLDTHANAKLNCIFQMVGKMLKAEVNN